MWKKLTIREEKFAAKYVECNSLSDAYRFAYTANNMKNTTIHVRALEVSKRGHVSDSIAKKLTERSERTEIDADYVLRRLVGIDRMDVVDIMCDDGSIKPISEWPKIWRTTISALDVAVINGGDAEAILKKIKWPDKVKNLELIGRHVDVQSWLDRAESTQNHKFEDMSDGEVRERITQLQKENKTYSTH